MPPPQPTSTAVSPAKGSAADNSFPKWLQAASRMNWHRVGFMAWSGANGPRWVSHLARRQTARGKCISSLSLPAALSSTRTRGQRQPRI